MLLPTEHVVLAQEQMIIFIDTINSYLCCKLSLHALLIPKHFTSLVPDHFQILSHCWYFLLKWSGNDSKV